MTSGNGALGRYGGTHPGRVGNDVGIDVGNDVGVNGLSHGGTGAGPAGLRSLPAKQHAPKARPLTRHRPWPAQPGPGQAVKGEWLRRGELRGGGVPDIRP